MTTTRTPILEGTACAAFSNTDGATLTREA